MKLKGIVLAVILSLASIMMPFYVYAAVQSQIVPTFSSSTSQWNGHLYVTNFSDGTNNQASSTLSFTFDDDYYGIIYFDGYGPSNQHIANYAACFVAGGYGEYRYSYYQNGVINITNVTINIVNVVKPDSSVDLTQIIQLLTAIETDTSSIDNLVDSTLTQIRNILSQLIISNGYLETISKLRQYNFPIESYSFVNQFYQYGFDIIDNFNDGYYGYPLFNVPASSSIRSNWSNGVSEFNQVLILGVSANTNDFNAFSRYISSSNINLIQYKLLFRKDRPSGNNQTFSIISIEYNIADSSVSNYVDFTTLSNLYIIPIYNEYYSDYFGKHISTDFALVYGLSNELLDNINIIANGTTQSNSAASNLESNNNQMADDMDDLATIESGYNQQFNNQLQQIDFSSPLQNNAGILPAANFVISIFNGLINNNPFSVLIIVVCILLIGKKVIGK